VKQMLECGTCGYPLLPEERTGMVEVNGKAVNPWKGLTDAEYEEFSKLAPLEVILMLERHLQRKNNF
jgi:hypothetical protein